MSIYNHPGYLGWTSEGVILIHADWPMYPAEHGWEIALLSLGQFPPGTIFRRIDDIDQCFLFLVERFLYAKDVFDERNFHVAAWREDIVQLHQAGYVSGASEIPLREWAERRCKELERMFCFAEDGTQLTIPKPDPDDFLEDEVEATVLFVDSEGLKVTTEGWKVLQEMLAASRPDLHPLLLKRASSIAELGHYDAAVREACVTLETRLKVLAASSDFGSKLVSKVFGDLAADERLIASQLKVLRTDVQTAFKFVRNDFMHNIKEIGAEQCWSLLARISRLLFSLDAIGSATAKDSSDNNRLMSYVRARSVTGAKL